MHLIKTKLLSAALMAMLPVAIPAALQAEGDESGSAAAISFTCAAWEKLPYTELFYRQGKEYLPIELPVGQRSGIYPLKGVGALELFIRKEPAADPGKSDTPPEYERVGIAPILEGAKRMLFLIEPKKGAEGQPLQLLGMDDSVEVFPGGSFRFLNQTPDLLYIEFGGATRKLPQDTLETVTPEQTEAGGFLPAVIRNEQEDILLESRFFAQRTGRELVIIRPPAEGRTQIVVKFLSDFVPANPPSSP